MRKTERYNSVHHIGRSARVLFPTLSAVIAASTITCFEPRLRAAPWFDNQIVREEQPLIFRAFDTGVLSIDTKTLEIRFREQEKIYSHKIKNRPATSETGEIVDVFSFPDRTWIVCENSLIMAIGRTDIKAQRTTMYDEYGDTGLDAAEISLKSILHGSSISAWSIVEDNNGRHGFFLGKNGTLATNDLINSRNDFYRINISRRIKGNGKRHLVVLNNHVFVFTSNSRDFIEIIGYPHDDIQIFPHKAMRGIPRNPIFNSRGSRLDIDGFMDNDTLTIITRGTNPAVTIPKALPFQPLPEELRR